MEKDLIKRVKKNDNEAFDELIRIYRPQLIPIAQSMLRNYESFVDDVIQDTFISVYLNIWKLINIENFKPWITKILINCCLDIIKENKNNLLYNDINISNSNYEFYETFESTIKDENDDLSTLQSERNFYDTIDFLSDNEQLLITLYYYFDYDYNKISKILNEKPGTLRMRMSRAFEKLRKKYKKEE